MRTRERTCQCILFHCMVSAVVQSLATASDGVLPTISKDESSLMDKVADLEKRLQTLLAKVSREKDNEATESWKLQLSNTTYLQNHVSNSLKLKPGTTLIFTAVTKGFLPSLANWMALIYRLGLSNFFIFAMDEESHNWLVERGFPSYVGQGHPVILKWAANRNNHYKRMQVWFERSYLILQLLTLGYNVVQSDGDALWLQNPMFELESLAKDRDVIFSRGNARAGKKGRGTGVCMGFVMYKASSGAKEFLLEVLEKMVKSNDVDQGVANSFVGGSRGMARDKDKTNPHYWFGEYKNMRWVQLPQTRYTRHAGAALNTVTAEVNLHVFHPTDEGWTLPYNMLPKVLPDKLVQKPENTSETVKNICHSGGWFERMGYSERDQRILKCCGLWMLKENWLQTPVEAGTTFEQWLISASYLKEGRELPKKHAYLEPPG
eukprot:m.92347 g.92347  ORF g.92347 m.92347 type:complete len:434 (+) comp13348_c0_seq1:47-1348(+)